LVSARPGGTPKVEMELLRLRASILQSQGQTAAAMAALDQALDVVPNDNETQLARGLLRLDTGQYAEGKADLLAVYERTGNYAGLTGPLGRIFVREGNMTELEKLVGSVLEQPEATNEELNVGARLRLAQGKPEEAKALAERVLASAANDWEAHLLLAEALVESGSHPEALLEIDASIPPSPSAEKHLWRGKILEFNARHTEAPAEYRKALALDPELHEARFLLARLLVRGGDSKAAADELAKVVAATDAFPLAWVELARAQKEMGEWDKAKANLKTALEKDATLYSAHYLMGYILATRDSNAAGGIASLEKATVEAAESNEDFGEAIFLLGDLYEKQKNTKAAKAAYERLIEVAPKHRKAPEAAKRLKSL
ncbi:MAG TPA: tetratricopeptide repeat protein, partial [Nannocystaceae bacterium]|nr:tetratricopeptide repeat protein [Nannocystaceae bacterium]